ncbi:MAG: hypothetical protein R3F31_27060 [Verrucomicrobiales bacterium]
MPLPKSKSQNALEKLWRFEGREADFWVELLREFSLQIEAASGMVLIKGESQADKPATWSAVAIWPEAEETKQRFAGQREALCRLADKSLREKSRIVRGPSDRWHPGCRYGLAIGSDRSGVCRRFSPIWG